MLNLLILAYVGNTEIAQGKASEYLNTRPLVCEEMIWLSHKFIFRLFAWMDELKFWKNINIYLYLQVDFCQNLLYIVTLPDGQVDVNSYK